MPSNAEVFASGTAPVRTDTIRILLSKEVQAVNAGGGGGGSAYSGYGTLAQRNALVSPVKGMVWGVSDSTPPNQLSQFDGSVWIGP